MKTETTVWKKLFALLMVLPIRGKKGYEEDSRESTKSEERGNKSSLFPIAFPALGPLGRWMQQDSQADSLAWIPRSSSHFLIIIWLSV